MHIINTTIFIHETTENMPLCTKYLIEILAFVHYLFSISAERGAPLPSGWDHITQIVLRELFAFVMEWMVEWLLFPFLFFIFCIQFSLFHFFFISVYRFGYEHAIFLSFLCSFTFVGIHPVNRCMYYVAFAIVPSIFFFHSFVAMLHIIAMDESIHDMQIIAIRAIQSTWG